MYLITFSNTLQNVIMHPMNNDAVAVPWFGQIVVYVQIKMAE